MPSVPSFYWIRELTKPIPERHYHNNTACRIGKEIPTSDRRPGTS